MQTWITADAWTAIYQPEFNPRTGGQNFTWDEVAGLAPEFVWGNDEINVTGLGASNAGVTLSLNLCGDVECNSYSVTRHPRRPGMELIVEWPYWEDCPTCIEINPNCSLCRGTGNTPIYTDTNTYAVAYLLGRRDAITDRNN